LTLPASLLLLTCLVAIIFATLVTRPIRTTGRIAMPPAEGRSANLFFFGNFYRMTFDEYKQGLRTVLSDHELLDEAIMADLYFLGKALGRKFWLLRICYLVFMVGITLTVVAFALTYLLTP
ncbi:MAG: phosphohydrolase, partial [Bacteroidetes bacterium]